MIAEGSEAPGFELPAVVDGSVDRVALEDYLGHQVVILAFYPADFNPACSDGSTDLDELDLFTMQKDVAILAISSDSVYSHQAFADQYELHIPLLSDPRGEVAAEYGVTVDDPTAGHLVNRAVVVIGLDGTVEFAWTTENLSELPPVERVRNSVDSVGGHRTAEARYGVGHAHYVEGRRQFTSAMQAFEAEEWMMARGDFEQAEAGFAEAADEFNTAVRFGEDAEAVRYFERAEDKAEALWQAAEWLAKSANAYASGEGADGQAMRRDAEGPLETARDVHEPIPPENFPPEEDPADREDEAGEVSILPEDEEDIDTTLDVDLDDAAGPDESVALDDGAEETAAEGDDAAPVTGSGAEGAAAGDAAAGNTAAEVGAGEVGEGDAAAGDGHGDDGDAADEGQNDIDDAELEEITAELEEQTEAAAEAAATEEVAADEAVEDEGETGVADDEGERGMAEDVDETGVADDERELGMADDDASDDGIDWDAEPGPVMGGEDDSADDEVAARETRGKPADAAVDAEGGAADDGGTADETGSETESDATTAPDAADVAGEIDEDDLELDLTDPSEGEDELVEPEEREVDEDGEATVDLDRERPDGDGAGTDGDDEEGGGGDGGDPGLDSGDHGVPDSL